MDPDDYDYPDPMHDGPEDEPPQPPPCADCESPNTEWLEDGEYVCNECDYVGVAEIMEQDHPDPYDDDYPIDGVGFADPGGNSALRAATKDNPRDQPCPNCERKNVLTRIDRQRGYQCDACADRAEGRMGGDY